MRAKVGDRTLRTFANIAMFASMDHGDVHDKNSFARYVVRIIAELDNPVRSRELQNVQLRSLLDAMEAWALDSDQPADPNPWRHAAEVLRAGLTYQ